MPNKAAKMTTVTVSTAHLQCRMQKVGMMGYRHRVHPMRRCETSSRHIAFFTMA